MYVWHTPLYRLDFQSVHIVYIYCTSVHHPTLRAVYIRYRDFPQYFFTNVYIKRVFPYTDKHSSVSYRAGASLRVWLEVSSVLRLRYFTAVIGDWGLWIGDCGLGIADCGLGIVDWGLWIGDCGLGIGDWGLGIGGWWFRLRIEDWGLGNNVGTVIEGWGLRNAERCL